MAVTEDKPLRDATALIDALGDTLGNLLQMMGEAVRTAKAAKKASGHPLNLELARRKLARTHQQVLRISSTLHGLLTYEYISELLRLATHARG